MYNWPIITGARRAKTMKHDYQMLDRDAGKLMCSRREELFFCNVSNDWNFASVEFKHVERKYI